MRLINKQLRYFACLYFMLCGTLFAQDIEPRRWNPLPSGTTILGITYGHNSGYVGFDPILELKDTKVKRDFLTMSYTHFFTLAEKLMRFDVLLPFHKVKWDGLLSGEPESVERTGMADPMFRLSVLHTLGAPTSEYKVSDDDSKETINTVVGAAISLGVPLGEYFEDKLLNLSSNSYMIRPHIGVQHTRGPWSYELTGSIFFFTDNDNFVDGNKFEQKPFYSAQAHIIRIFEPGVWGSVSTGYGQGAASKINGKDRDDKREGFLWGLAMGVPLTADQTLKFSYIWAKTQTDTEPRFEADNFIVGWTIRF